MYTVDAGNKLAGGCVHCRKKQQRYNNIIYGTYSYAKYHNNNNIAGEYINIARKFDEKIDNNAYIRRKRGVYLQSVFNVGGFLVAQLVLMLLLPSH